MLRALGLLRRPGLSWVFCLFSSRIIYFDDLTSIVWHYRLMETVTNSRFWVGIDVGTNSVGCAAIEVDSDGMPIRILNGKYKSTIRGSILSMLKPQQPGWQFLVLHAAHAG